MSKRKKQRKNAAVPEEVLAEGSGPIQDADSLAEAASAALAGDGKRDEDVVFEAADAAEAPSAEAAEAPAPTGPGEAPADDDSGSKAKAKSKGKGRRGKRLEVTSDEPMIEQVAGEAGDEAVIEAAALESALAVDVLDSEVGPELEEAEVAADEAAQADEQVLEDAVMRAEAEAELGAAEPEAEAGEADLELGAALPTTAGTMDDVQLKHLVEALIFAADKPVTMQRLRQLTRVSDVKRLEQALATLATDFADRGIALQQVSGGYQFRTNTQYSTWVQQLIAGRPVRLSRAQLETLAIVAYRQPITRPEVDEIRGVDSSATLRLLMDRALIRILGKKEDVGRPILYGTTKEFLDFFSLGDLRELPTLREYSELTAESRQVMSDRLGIGAEPPSVDGVSEDGEIAESDDANVVVAQEMSVDDMVREFATSNVDAPMTTDDAAVDAADLASDELEMSGAEADVAGNEGFSASELAGEADIAGDELDMAGAEADIAGNEGSSASELAGEADIAGDADIAGQAGIAGDELEAAAAADVPSDDVAVVGAEADIAGDADSSAANLAGDADIASDADVAGDELEATANDENVASDGLDAAADETAVEDREVASDLEATGDDVVAEPAPDMGASADSTLADDESASDAHHSTDVSAPEALDSDDEPPTD